MTHFFWRCLVALGVCLGGLSASAALLTVRTNVLGGLPEVIGYNCGHFYPGSNTRDWWHYSRVSGARIFIQADDIEASDDLAPFGDGVNSATSFTNRQALLRANPNSTTYINWPYLTNRYENTSFSGVNEMRLNYACTELRRLGIDILVNISANESTFPITSTNDWAGKWELWQHFYFQAFYLGKNFDVHRFQMYNEPDAVTNLTQSEWLMRLQLASDAVQAAIADVDSLYGKTLVAQVLAPVNAGSATSDFNGGLGGLAVTNRHVNFLGVSNSSYSVLQKYDFHEYGASPSGYANDVASLNGLLTAAMSPESRLPTSISEFNTHTASTFETIADTLDSPQEYAELGDIAVSLAGSTLSELYLFKFTQTLNSATGKPAKNGLHFADNSNVPYQTGGITKAGEVWRLFNKACQPGRNRYQFSGGTGLDSVATYDPATQTYYLFSVNNTGSSVSMTNVLTDWQIPIGNAVLLEEVSESTFGAGKSWQKVSNARTVAGVQPAYSAWLYTIPSRPQNTEQIINATDDAQATDGTNKGVNYGANSTLLVRNDTTNTANRSAGFMKFTLPAITRTNVQLAVLSLTAATISSNTTAQAYVYLLDATNWSQSTLVWSNAPNLLDNIPAGATLQRSLVQDAGGTAHLAGQLVVTTTNAAERLIDVTDFIRDGTNSALSFLVVQTPRWDTNQLSTAVGDTQPDGIQIVSGEGGVANTNTPGPRLRLVLAPAGSNNPPVAVTNSYSTAEDIRLTVSAPGVLVNDTDADNDLLTALLVTGPAHGALTLNADGSFNYLPATNYAGADSFTYKANDGQADSASALVTLSITQVNDAPTAVPDIVYTTQNVAVVISPLVNDFDVDSNTVSLVSFTQPAHGNTLSNSATTITYTPASGYIGSDSFSYTITDGQGGTNSASVTVNVLSPDTAPVLTNLSAAMEAFVRGGVNAVADQDEAATGYVMVKYSTGLDTSRKAWFQFDLSGLSVNTSTQATFTVVFTNANQQRVQLWGLNQPYTNFSSAVTWNSVQANDTNSNDLLVSGPFTAGALGASVLVPTNGTTPYSFTVTNLASLIQGGRVTLALSGVNDAANNSGGLRLARNSATLAVVVNVSTPVTNPPTITSSVFSNNQLTLYFHGASNRLHWVQARSDLQLGAWTNASTNVADAAGNWIYLDGSVSNQVRRFYRAVLP